MVLYIYIYNIIYIYIELYSSYDIVCINFFKLRISTNMMNSGYGHEQSLISF